MSDSRENTNTESDRPEAALAAAPSDKPLPAGRQGFAGLIFLAALALFSLSLLASLGLFFFRDGALPSRPEQTPLSILPPAPGGTTILAKQPDDAELPVRSVPAPVAEGAARATGYAVDLGAALSFSDLSARFAEISRQNAEVEFDRLEPRATLRDTQNGLEARLLVGPFATLRAAGETCARIALPAGIECRAVPFEGELIARE